MSERFSGILSPFQEESPAENRPEGVAMPSAAAPRAVALKILEGLQAQSQAGSWDIRGLAASSAASTAHEVLAALQQRHDLPGSRQAGGSELSRCLCPVCSRLEVLNADLETLEAAGPEASAASTSFALASSLDLSKTFFLNSNPTANHTIYLDFDGHYMASSQWENGGALQLRPFYSDFTSSATLLEIQRIWQRIAEDFAPFNVNVTTQEPNAEDLLKSGTGDTRWGIRMAFTYNTNLLTGNAITNAGGGGTAYYNSFNWSTDDVALGFNRGEYAAAETGSHEIGHTLNLRHDGGSYGSNATYYEGHGGTGPTSWASIMGASFINSDENLTTWSRGEYIGANNTQDDLYTITNGNGFTYLADDHGSTRSSATWLQGVSFNEFGIIERNTDIDYFRFDTGSGTINLSIINASRVFVADGLGGYTTEYLAARGPNLDISASLYRSDGTWIATSNPLDQITASFNDLYLDAGSYYLAIDGVGVGDPFSNPPTGYTDYASIGQYAIQGTVQAGGPVTPTYALSSSADSVNEGGTVTFTVTTTGVAAGTVLAWKITGVAAADLVVGAQTQGTLTVDQDGIVTVPINLLADQTTEGPETLTFTLYSDLSSTAALAPGRSVTVNDTSQAVVVQSFDRWGTTASDVITGGDAADRLAGVLATGTKGGSMGKGQIDTLTGYGAGDTFLLADSRGTFYNDGNSRSQGTGDYALIKDFNAAAGDMLQLKSGSQYLYRNTTISNVAYTEIYLGNGDSGFSAADELIARLEGAPLSTSGAVALASSPTVFVLGNPGWASFVPS
ncbi:MAG: M12 family metallo-peptidase [Cyanobacteriota bacterium]|nr:M12 family metallo-peptidase [Cyanobacteriota bacterium]